MFFFHRKFTPPPQGADGKLVKDEDQFMRMKCDFVITAFGARKDDEMVQAMSPLTFNVSTIWMFGVLLAGYPIESSFLLSN